MKNTLFLFATLLLIAFASCSDDGNDIPTPEKEAFITIDPSISTNGLTFDAAGGEKSISITSNRKWTLIMSAINDGKIWCSASITNGEEGDTIVKFIVKENSSYDERSVPITFKAENISKTFTITQMGVNALLVDSSKFDVPQKGGTIDVEVKANVDYAVEISADWIKQTAATRGLKSKQYHFTVDENTAKAKREGTITFIYKELKQVVKVTQLGEIPYVTFTAEASQTLTMSKAVNTLQFSLNGEDWKPLNTNSVTFGGEYGALRLRGKSSVGTVNSSGGYSQILFGNDTPVACSGDIRTLVDYEDYENADTSNARFSSLFYRCTSLTSAPELPATTLAYRCYASMFKGCISLTSAPELPATTLAENCYESMFKDCTGLSAAPKLPATALVKYCYDSMFRNCTKLTTAPELPATSLAEKCYFYMFYGCTSLTAAPKLSATTLAEMCYYSMFERCISLTAAPKLSATTLARGCYEYMFGGCTSLTIAPKLPATTLAEYCYDSMFRGCTSLTTAPELPATTLAENCYSNMFYGCTSLTTALKLPATTLAGYCYEYMFYGCTSLTTAPELPATTLAESCYYDMFYGCTSLTTAPKLSATTLARGCYEYMFGGCTSLNKVTMLATDITATDALHHWLDGVSSTGTFIKAAEMNDLPKGSDGIPEGWTVKNYGE